MAVPANNVFGSSITLTGTPVALTGILSAQQITDRMTKVQSVQVQAHPSNAGVVYIGCASDFTNGGANCMAAIPKPTAATTGPFPSQSYSVPGTGNNPIDLARLWVNGTGADIVLVSVIQI